MIEVIGIRFQQVGQIYYYAPEKEMYALNDKVIVALQDIRCIGTVVTPVQQMDRQDLPDEVKTIIRQANSQDLAQEATNAEDAIGALQIAKGKVRDRRLPMKLINAAYTLERNKLIFSFTAEGRIDFRELVKDLANVFHTRIELRQIGVRDEAKLLGGIGPCGRKLCCATFLGDFIPVSIKMAKDQGLSLNPTKISGLCGRLMCCLKYENEEYEQAKKEMPDRGKEVETPDGKGRVVGLDLLSRVVKVRLHDRQTAVEYDYEELVTK
ncbi:stage 0 sporulation family protein [Enterococcus sp.]|uniref:PSP1 domain-containing protein n=1 Tax=Enterococcus sp. TaxID=35783 RepID=UPI0028A2DD76|nr:stage 0 sporulation family protein [Enterococcus sp.]